jgi:transposase InsO family protein
LWLTDLTEHRTSEVKVYLLEKEEDVFNKRIAGYSFSDRMKARMSVDALEGADDRRGNPVGVIVHSGTGSVSGTGSDRRRLRRSARP